jgi:alcohol dehydrogenase YqhD (iron-dependent ADH family)
MEIIRPGFADRPLPILSYGIPFPEAAARHIVNTFQARRVYVICSRSLAEKTSILEELDRVFRTNSISMVGQRIGMKPHTLWSEVLDIAAEARTSEADVFLTIGGGTLTDGAKAVVLVLTPCGSGVCTIEKKPWLTPATRPWRTMLGLSRTCIHLSSDKRRDLVVNLRARLACP